MLSIEDVFKQQRQLLIRRLDRWLSLKQYFKGSEQWADGRPKTWCNVAARDFIDSEYHSPLSKGGLCSWYNLDISVLGDTPRNLILCTPIPKYLKLVGDAYLAMKLDLLSPSYAISLAQLGIPIHVINLTGTHEAILHPSSKMLTPTTAQSIIVAQHGEKSGILSAYDQMSFGIKDVSELVFVLYPLMVD
jgi:hypothetical protein